MRDFVCKVWCPSQCPHIVAFYITVQCLSEPSVALGTHSLLRRSRQHNTPYGAGGCHTSSSCFVFLCVFLGALLGSGTCVKGAPHVNFALMEVEFQSGAKTGHPRELSDSIWAPQIESLSSL